MGGALERADDTPPADTSTPVAKLAWHQLVRAGCWLAAGMLGVVATLLVANAGVATILAAPVVPLVFLAYVRRANEHESAPISVLALMMAGGAVVGALLAALSRLYVEQLQLAQIASIAQGRPPTSAILLLGVTVPLVAELLKLAGPLLLRRRSRFGNEVIDGAVLGVAAGVGYAAAATLVNYWPIVRDGYAPAGMAGVVEWSATLFGLTILRPLMHGLTSGLIVAGIWAAMARRGSGIVPVLAGLFGAVAYGLGELLLARHGTLAVLMLHSLLLAMLSILLWRTLHD